MALVVEDGSQKTDAESYSSVADADAYIARWHGNSVWEAADDPTKERALLKATRYIDSFRFVGQVTDPDQALAWPRSWVGSVDGKIFESEEIPIEIKHATIEAAMRVVDGENLFVDHDGGTISSESKSVGSLSVSTTYSRAKQPGKEFQEIEALLHRFLQSTRGLQRSL